MLCPYIKQTEFRRVQFFFKNIQQNTIAFGGPMTVFSVPSGILLGPTSWNTDALQKNLIPNDTSSDVLENLDDLAFVLIYGSFYKLQ